LHSVAVNQECGVNDKNNRHQAIREIVSARAVASQDELRRLLVKRGWDVTQSTLSRDLRELRLARIPGEQGAVRYAAPENGHADSGGDQLQALLPRLLLSVEGVQVLVVARTVSSGAQPVAAALDHSGWPEVAGTIAGDDTVLVICRNTAGRERVLKRLRAYIG
jgi:transcriptional regulator of arginine metabolism